MIKRHAKKGVFCAEMQKSLAEELIKKGKIKKAKDFCKHGICPVIVGFSFEA